MHGLSLSYASERMCVCASQDVFDSCTSTAAEARPSFLQLLEKLDVCQQQIDQIAWQAAAAGRRYTYPLELLSWHSVLFGLLPSSRDEGVVCIGSCLRSAVTQPVTADSAICEGGCICCASAMQSYAIAFLSGHSFFFTLKTLLLYWVQIQMDSMGDAADQLTGKQVKPLGWWWRVSRCGNLHAIDI